MTINSSFDKYLEESGLKKYVKNTDSLNLRLYHDLNIYGDIAESYVELLRDNYDVDVSEFVFRDYFPDEFVGKSFMSSCLFSVLPFLRKNYDSKDKFKPFTFHKIKQAIMKRTLV